ncbi:glycosyltransferase [Limnoglobus roseus]|uniref:glycosyltransferase n=1 Tax=Limnoglobus roseus TaxID=2598579 RepID=UPI001C499CB6|nr:glycosyltransferase [Limnoglobus roseus]
MFSAVRELSSRGPVNASQRIACEQLTSFAVRWLADLSNGQRVIPYIEEAARAAVCDRSPSDPARHPKIGLVGPQAGFGLAHLNRDVAVHLGIDRWLVVGPRSPASDTSCRTDVVSHQAGTVELETWLEGLDVVLFAERPFFPDLTGAARRAGALVACVPMLEWLHPGMEWLGEVDLMICPTRHAARVLADWKQRYGFAWAVECVPWPIDVDRFRFRQRRSCGRFVYVHGSGGARGERGDGSHINRKGLSVLVEAARRVPEIPVLVYAPLRDVPSPPQNVSVCRPPKNNAQLFDEGDVCVQPSHWEGLGLPLLECQAAGLPLITTDAAPMNEHRPLAVIPCTSEAVQLGPDLFTSAAVIDPVDLADVLRSVHRQNIASHSSAARHFVESEHAWKTAAPEILRFVGTSRKPVG